MNWLHWTPCLSVSVGVGSCFTRKRSSCFSPTSLASDCTTFVLLMMKMKTKRRWRKRKRREKLQQFQQNHHLQVQAERKVFCLLFPAMSTCGVEHVSDFCYGIIGGIVIITCLLLTLLFRIEHTCVLWRSAAMVPW